jgi:tyrosinase
MHNRVHICIGDMGSSTSPNNDPVFYLNHCNVDRIGQYGMKYTIVPLHPPDAQSDTKLRGHRLNGQIIPHNCKRTFDPIYRTEFAQ